MRDAVHMKTIAAFVALFVASLAGFAAGLEFAIANDHTNLLYRVGEESVFTVTATRDGKPVSEGWVDAKLDNFGPAVQMRKRIDLAKTNPFTVKGTLAEPGFLRPSSGPGGTFGWRHVMSTPMSCGTKDQLREVEK